MTYWKIHGNLNHIHKTEVLVGWQMLKLGEPSNRGLRVWAYMNAGRVGAVALVRS